MSMTTDLVSSEIARIAPYEPGKPIEELEREMREAGVAWPKEGAIKLASNENPLGPSPKGLEAAARALAQVHLYPDGGAFYLRQALAARLGVDMRQIVAGGGSNELIDLLISTYVAPDEEVVAPAVSFACYRLSCEAHRRKFREVPNGPRFAYDLEALAAACGPKTKLVFLANPNNPTGVYAGREAFARFLAALPERVLLAVDEAYIEYVRAADYPDTLAMLKDRERMVLLRTFSKIYGLAGLRVGYAIGQAHVIEWMHRVRLPFNVGSVAQVAARAALDDEAHVARSRALVAEELPRLEAALAALGLEVTPSQTNFVLVDLAPRLGAKANGRAVYEALLRRGVIVRPMGGYGLPSSLRITVGTAPENARLLESLREVLSE
jgi:histidinol-phosphate aminotransferase